MKQITRDFKVSDLYLIEFSTTMLDHFITDQAEFSAFDAEFGTPFESDWQALIDAALAFPTDETVVDQLQQLTLNVEEAMEACQVKFRASKYFIERAFSNAPGTLNEFGFDDFKRARGRQMPMVQFMQKFFDTATKYAAELDAVGFDAAAIAEIQTLGVALVDANRAQESFKGTRSTTAQDRVLAMNAVWDVMVRVSKAGKIIFMDNPAKYQLFLLPASSETGDDISIRGFVSDPADAPLEGVAVNIASLGIDTATDSNGNYAFGNLDEGSYTLNFSTEGYTPAEFENVEVIEDETTELDVTLEPEVVVNTSISGTVTDTSTLSPIANAQVSLITGGVTINTTTNGSGEYVLMLDGASTVSGNLEASATGYATDSRPVTVNPGDTLTENFSLTAQP